MNKLIILIALLYIFSSFRGYAQTGNDMSVKNMNLTSESLKLTRGDENIGGKFKDSKETVFENEDNVCFIGNSITFNGSFYHNIALFYATRFPQKVITVYNCGVGGNMAANVINRMDNDILIHSPQWSVLMLGMNDVNKSLYAINSDGKPGIDKKRQEALNTYRKNYEQIILTLLEHNSRIILQTPSIYDQTAVLPAESFFGRNDALKTCADYVKEFGKKYDLKGIDYWSLMEKITRQVQLTNPNETIIGQDRVHPGPVGHFIMSYQFLKSMKIQPLISDIVIYSGKSGKLSTENCTITDLSIKDKQIQFTCLEKSLPFPVVKNTERALELVPFMNELNREFITIKRLKQGNYQLKIDDVNLGTYSEKEFDRGINLATITGSPQYIQALKVLTLFQEYWHSEAQLRWVRAIEIGRLNPKNIYTVDEAEKLFNTQINETTDTTGTVYKDLIYLRKNYVDIKNNEKQKKDNMVSLHKLIYQVNQPVAHQYEIVKL